MFPFNYLEYGLGSLLYSLRARDAKLFTKGPAFTNIPPTITITSPDVGPSESTMGLQYTGYGEDRFPSLEWAAPSPSSPSKEIKQYILVIEDPDAPIPSPPTHGLFYYIPATTTCITAHDIALKDPKKKKGEVNGDFRVGKNLYGSVYLGPKPPLGHGVHRYFYQLVGLTEELSLSARPGKKEVAEAIGGKVAAWGCWVGVFEKKWE
jgi:phosphatidylethanolamine-binding protein (PEBP) family uncharacterized protein